jgi:hypothetical protein
MKVIKTFMSEDKTKNSLIGLTDEIFVVEFYENGRRVGEIEYPDKSYHYVQDAADNWCTGIMTVETIKNYCKVA